MSWRHFYHPNVKQELQWFNAFATFLLIRHVWLWAAVMALAGIVMGYFWGVLVVLISACGMVAVACFALLYNLNELLSDGLPIDYPGANLIKGFFVNIAHTFIWFVCVQVPVFSFLVCAYIGVSYRPL